jgi:HSP20 family molecular chaperone IbpA
MASDFAVKRDKHRQQMEILDRSQRHEVWNKKEKHRESMRGIRERHAIEKQETQITQKNQLENLKQKNDTFVQNERLNHQDRLAKQNLQAQEDYQKAANEKARENARLRREAQVERENLVGVRDQARQATVEKKEVTSQQLEDMDKESRFRLKQKQEQHRERERSMQMSHNKEVHRIEQQGQENIKVSRDKYLNRERVQKKGHNDRLRDQEKQFLAVKERQHKHYHKKLENEEEYFQGRIRDQRQEYKKRFNENDKAHKATFENQENRLAEEMFKLRKEFITTAQFYDDRKEDPFYSLVDFGADFIEGNSFYEVKARIPEHEMKNVRVHVQPNKISLHATRMHEQEFKAQNEKIGSNIAQTIRQEFELAQTADYEKVIKSYEDGVLTITVPKKGFVFGVS